MATVSEILQTIQARRHGELKHQLGEEIKSRVEVEGKLLAAKSLEEDRLSRIRLRAQTVASAGAKILQVIVLVLLTITLISTFPWQLPPLQAAWSKYLIAALQVALLLYTVFNNFYGTTIQGLVRKVEGWLAERIEKVLLSISS